MKTEKRVSNVLIISIFAGIIVFSVLVNKSAARVAIWRIQARIENVKSN